MDRCLWFTIAAVGLLALGCTAPAPLPPAGAEDQPRYGGTITIGIGQDPWDFDLSIIGRSAGNSDSIFLSYESVIGVKTGPEVDYHEVVLEPLLAERWEVSPDARIFTFHLRKGVKFADLPPVDGRQLTSADVKWSHEYWTRTGPFKDKGLRAGQFAFYLAGLDRVEAPDPGTVVVHFKEPFAPFLNYAAAYQNPILPHEIYDLDGNFSSRIVGTGPWQYDEAASQKGTRWVWKKNPDYWQPGRPYIEEVRRIILPDPATFGPAFKTKQIDLITQSLQQGEQLKKEVPSAVFHQYFGGGGTGNVYMNTGVSPLNDVRIRRAILLSLDRDELIRVLENGVGRWALAGMFEGFFTQEEIRNILRYDPQEARRLVGEAGYPNGVDVEWMYPATGTATDYVPLSTLVQAQLKKGGINLVQNPVEFTDWLTRTRVGGQGNYQMTPRGQAVKEDVDAYAYGSFHSGSPRNYGRVKDPELDRLLDAQRREPDPAKRKEIVRQVGLRIAEFAWGLRTHASASYQIWHPYLKNYAPTTCGTTGP